MNQSKYEQEHVLWKYKSRVKALLNTVQLNVHVCVSLLCKAMLQKSPASLYVVSERIELFCFCVSCSVMPFFAVDLLHRFTTGQFCPSGVPMNPTQPKCVCPLLILTSFTSHPHAECFPLRRENDGFIWQLSKSKLGEVEKLFAAKFCCHTYSQELGVKNSFSGSLVCSEWFWNIYFWSLCVQEKIFKIPLNIYFVQNTLFKVWSP